MVSCGYLWLPVASCGELWLPVVNEESDTLLYKMRAQNSKKINVQVSVLNIQVSVLPVVLALMAGKLHNKQSINSMEHVMYVVTNGVGYKSKKNTLGRF